MKMKFHLIGLLIFAIIFQITGQNNFRPGFIITLQNDTVFGKVHYGSSSNNSKICRFKSETGVTEYVPSQIYGFGYLDDKCYTSRILKDTFIETLIEGNLSLFKSNSDFFMLKEGGEAFKLESIEKEEIIKGHFIIRKDNTWRGNVFSQISDCSPDLKVLMNLDLIEKDLMKTVIDYNKCKGHNYINYKIKKPRFKIDVGVIMGLTRSSISMDRNYQSIDPSYGLIMTVSSPRITEKFAFQSEIQFIKADFSSLEIKKLTAGDEYHHTYVDLSAISIPLSFKYSMSKTPYALFLNAGVNNSYNLKSDTRHYYELINDNHIIDSGKLKPVRTREWQIGFWGGIGITKSLGKINVSSTIRYYQMKKLNKDFIYGSQMNAISLLIILATK